MRPNPTISTRQFFIVGPGEISWRVLVEAIQIAIPDSGNEGNMTADLGQFDLANEIAASQRQQSWPSGIRAKTLFQEAGFSSRADLDEARHPDEGTPCG